jgi:hypothetical protein
MGGGGITREIFIREIFIREGCTVYLLERRVNIKRERGTFNREGYSLESGGIH